MNQQKVETEMNDSDVERRDPFLDEILEQGDVVTACADNLGRQLGELEALRSATRQNAPIVFTGMGSSYDALQALSSVLLRQGRLVSLVNTAELLHFGMPAQTPETLVLAVSQSGRSAELVELAARSREGGFKLAAVTNGGDNPLHRQAAIAIELGAGDEQGPSTKSYTATLVALSLIGQVMVEESTPIPELVTRNQEALLAAGPALRELLGRGVAIGGQLLEWGRGGSLFFIGRGVGIAAAEVGALIMKEAGHRAVIGMDCAEFRHGPLELAGPDLKVILVSIEKDVDRLDARLVADLQEAGARVVVIGPDGLGARDHIRIEPTGRPMHDAILASVPLQMMTWAAASANSSEPGTFRIGSKVTSSL